MHVTCIFYLDDPSNDDKIEGDPHKTVFIARLVSDVIHGSLHLCTVFSLRCSSDNDD